MQWFPSKKNIDKLVQDQFLQPVKVHPCDKFGHVDKIMPCFFFQKRLKNVKFKKIREHHAKRFEKRWAWCFWIFDTLFFLITFEKKTSLRFFHDFWVKPNFSESALFQREIVGLNNFRPAIGVCIVNVMISIKKYSSKVFRISFHEFFKVTTLLITNIL